MHAYICMSFFESLNDDVMMMSCFTVIGWMVVTTERCSWRHL